MGVYETPSQLKGLPTLNSNKHRFKKDFQAVVRRVLEIFEEDSLKLGFCFFYESSV